MNSPGAPLEPANTELADQIAQIMEIGENAARKAVELIMNATTETPIEDTYTE